MIDLYDNKTNNWKNDFHSVLAKYGTYKIPLELRKWVSSGLFNLNIPYWPDMRWHFVRCTVVKRAKLELKELRRTNNRR